MGFDVANAVKISEEKLQVRTHVSQSSLTMIFTIQDLKRMRQYHLDKADEMQALIDKASSEGVKE